MERTFRIGEMAEILGIPASKLRYWESMGLLDCVRGTENQYRLYQAADLMRVSDLMFYRSLGLSVKSIAAIDAMDVPAHGALCAAREEALEDWKEGRADNDLMDSLQPEVLRDRYRIHVDDIEQLKQTVDQVAAISGIADTNAAYEIAQGFVTVRNIAAGVAVVLVTILAVVSLFIIANTIKLAFFYRREEIAIMKMCGATNAFIRWPFVVQGMILGLAGAIVAFFLQWGVYELVSKTVIQSDGLSLVTILPFPSLILNILPVFCGAGLLIGVVGSVLAIRKFLQV